MSARAKLVRVFWLWLAPLAGLGALALAFYFVFHSPRERSYRLRMTAGNTLGMRHQLAQALRAEVARRGLDLALHETPSSEEALDEVNNHTLDVALVQGGLKATGRPHVRQVLALHMEALHLLVKKDLFDDVSRHLGALDGKTVNLGEAGSGTHSLSVEVLAFAGLHARSADHPGGYVPLGLSRQQLFAEKDDARLPDAVLLVSLLPSPTARYLVTKHGYRLVPLPFGEAFALEGMTPAEPGSGDQPPPSLVDKGHTYPTLIPAFTCCVEPPVPAQPVPTLGTRLLLVAHQDVSPQAVRQLLEATLESQVARGGRPPIDAQALDLPPEFPWHEGTRLYQDRNKPVVSGTIMDSAHKGLAIFAATASGLFVLWQWSKMRRQLAGAEGFTPYIHQVTGVEKQALQLGRGQPAGAAQLRALLEELGRLKTEALDRFTQGELGGKELLVGFLAQVADVRACLTRLVLEQEAQPGGQAGKEDAPLVAP
jgi:TRAP-type uncharacterized transport system substrate-binding protein